MEYRKLGKSDLQVSRISFGTMSLKQGGQSNKEIIYRALDLGINYFDTADLYDKGENEKLIGSTLKGKRKDVVIATKVGNQWREDGSGWGWNPRKKYILTCVEDSLERLNTDYIDLYQLHGGTIQDPIDETIEAFELLVQQGKIRYYGISSIRPNVILEYVKRSNIVSVMMQYSLLDRRPEETCLSLLQQHGISVVTRGSVAQGLLIDKPSKNYLNYSAEEVQSARYAIFKMSSDQRTLAQTALQFVLRHAAITSAVVGMRTLAQLEEAVNTIKALQLSNEEYQRLQSVLPVNYYEAHR